MSSFMPEKVVVEVESIAPIVYMDGQGWQIFAKNLAKTAFYAVFLYTFWRSNL